MPKATRDQVAAQCEAVRRAHNPHVGEIKSAWVENPSAGCGSNVKDHPVLSQTIAGAADNLSPVATAPQNAKTVEQSVQDPRNTPVPNLSLQAQAVNAAAPKPSPIPGK